ncbi:hypothetical protein [Luteolibacter soli]|uniref:Uncharacterized protein n=1 Tax=Luteolibacter soli TaxID=3135280 RepID=A0ABU9AWC5_9BACT
MGFLAFGWMRSMSYHDNLSWSMGTVHHGISQRVGSIEFYRLIFPVAMGDGLKVTTLRPDDPQGAGFPPALAWKSEGVPGFVQHHGVFVAHWLLMLLFLLPWLGWIFLRVRKQEKPSS